MISGRPVSRKAGDDVCFELARKWRTTCLENHRESCLRTINPIFPTRIIDVGPVDGSCEPRLWITKLEEGNWVALSHCWGKGPQFMTTLHNIADRKRAIPFKDMPQTFQDAIITTRKMGYQFLWIDSLCIVQDDHDDWVAESIRMGDYYKHAILTISADSAPEDHVGFLNQDREDYLSTVVKVAPNYEVGIRKMYPCANFRNRDTWVSKRAWTLQEFVLSPRTLHYTAEQIIWECQTRKYCESSDNSQGDSDAAQYGCMKRFFAKPSVGKEIFPDLQKFFDPSYRWYSLVSDYFQRDLTFRSDILAAISGLAKEIQRQTSHTYSVGIWLEAIEVGLLWQVDGAKKKSETYCGPSWSWVSVETVPEAMGPENPLYQAVLFLQPEFKECRARLISHNIVLNDNNPFGSVSFGSLFLHGKYLLASQWKGTCLPYCNSYEGLTISYFFSEGEMMPESLDQLIYNFDLPEEDIMLENSLADLIIFQISTWKWRRQENPIVVTLALLLLPVKGKPADTYQRVGIAEVPNTNCLESDGWGVKEICTI